jgi:hypothetical protein
VEAEAKYCCIPEKLNFKSAKTVKPYVASAKTAKPYVANTCMLFFWLVFHYMLEPSYCCCILGLCKREEVLPLVFKDAMKYKKQKRKGHPRTPHSCHTSSTTSFHRVSVDVGNGFIA